jgi:hypothetical protein
MEVQGILAEVSDLSKPNMWDNNDRWHTFPCFCVSDSFSLSNSIADERIRSFAAKRDKGVSYFESPHV